MKYFTQRLNKAFKKSKLTLDNAIKDVGDRVISRTRFYEALKGHKIKNNEIRESVENWIIEQEKKEK